MKRIAVMLSVFLIIMSTLTCVISLSNSKLRKQLSDLQNDTTVASVSSKKESTSSNSDSQRYLDNCAKALVALYDSCPCFDERNISNIFYATDNSAYAILFGNDVVTIISNYLGTDCTYIVSNRLNKSLNDVASVYYNEQYKLNIHAIGVENYTRGGYVDLFNYVSDTYIDMAKSECEEIDIKTVRDYVQENYK